MKSLIQKIIAESFAEKLTVTADQTAQFAQFLQLLQKWNKAFNLTSITDTEAMIRLHLIDSLSINPYLHGSTMLDIGSGGGLPGIPLAIINPQTTWTLLDKNSKKTRFLTQVCAELGLKNIIIVNERIENFHPASGFDTILSRAFGSLKLFVEVASPVINPKGLVLAMKGKFPQDELKELNELAKKFDIVKLTIKGMDTERHIVRLWF